MKVIEPCCFSKQLTLFLNSLSSGVRHKDFFFTNSEWTLAQLISEIVWYAPNGTLSLCLSRISQCTLSLLTALLERRVNSSNGFPVIAALEIVLPYSQTYNQELMVFARKYKERVTVVFRKIPYHGSFLCLHNEEKNDCDYVIVGQFNEFINPAHDFRFFTVHTDSYAYNEFHGLVTSWIKITNNKITHNSETV